ncbi:MAG: DUF4013 domain-containing protein [bacterium]
MKLDYTKAFKDLFTNSDLKSGFLITSLLTFVSLICITILNTKGLSLPLGMKLLAGLTYFATCIIISGYYLEVMNNEINNKLNSLPIYENKIGSYFVNGLKYILFSLIVMIAIILLLIPVAILLGVIGGISGLTHASHAISPALIILIPLLILFSIFVGFLFQVLTSQFAENFNISQGLKPIKATKFLFNNFGSYLKVTGIQIIINIVYLIICSIISFIIGIILGSAGFTGIKSPMFPIIVESIDLVGITPLVLYMGIVTTDLYAQIYRLGNEQKTEIISE